jgi:hypothetical protein
MPPGSFGDACRDVAGAVDRTRRLRATDSVEPDSSAVPRDSDKR